MLLVALASEYHHDLGAVEAAVSIYLPTFVFPTSQLFGVVFRSQALPLLQKRALAATST